MRETSSGPGSLRRSVLAMVLGFAIMIGVPAAMASVAGPDAVPTAMVVGNGGGVPVAVTAPTRVP